MCEEVGLSVTTISQIEQGKSTTVESLIRILIRLNRIKILNLYLGLAKIRIKIEI
ncbi:MAG: helix-turn-helix domain-containing protein [Bacteroidetes bacterium]|nr:helix-turn-helix domain-containing protein [Bacteroidota bacterium]